MRQVGIYAGTFDPIHDGHITFAKTCARDLALDKVVLLPEESPRGKLHVTSIDERVAMIKKTTRHDNSLILRMPQTAQFTVHDTLPLLKTWYPDAILTLLIGSDVAMHLHTWPHLERLLDAMHIAIGIRSQHTEKEVRDALDYIHIPALSYSIHHTDASHISSSQLR